MASQGHTAKGWGFGTQSSDLPACSVTSHYGVLLLNRWRLHFIPLTTCLVSTVSFRAVDSSSYSLWHLRSTSCVEETWRCLAWCLQGPFWAPCLLQPPLLWLLHGRGRMPPHSPFLSPHWLLWTLGSLLESPFILAFFKGKKMRSARILCHLKSKTWFNQNSFPWVIWNPIL